MNSYLDSSCFIRRITRDGPGVLDWDGPAILLSVKRDMLDATIKRRRNLGEVRVFDPSGLVTLKPIDPNESWVEVPTSELARW